MMTTILAFDPGVKNFAFAVAQAQSIPATTPPPVVASGLVPPLGSPNDDAAFLEAILGLLDVWSPDAIVAERYTHRGPMSVHSETINHCLGRLAVLSHLRLTPCHFVLPATWKNFMKRRDLLWESTYGQLSSIHEKDAAGIAWWYSLSIK